MTDDERMPTPAEGADDEPILSEGVGGVPDIPPQDRATVGDADEVNVDTDEPQVESNR
jgi:hypothetical protein